MLQTQAKLRAFLQGLNSADVDRLKDVAITAFNENVPDVPGPDKIVRPVIENAIRKAVSDACAGN